MVRVAFYVVVALVAVSFVVSSLRAGGGLVIDNPNGKLTLPPASGVNGNRQIAATTDDIQIGGGGAVRMVTNVNSSAPGLMLPYNGNAQLMWSGDGTYRRPANANSTAPGYLPSLDGNQNNCVTGDGSLQTRWPTITTPDLTATASSAVVLYVSDNVTTTTVTSGGTTKITITGFEPNPVRNPEFTLSSMYGTTGIVSQTAIVPVPVVDCWSIYTNSAVPQLSAYQVTTGLPTGKAAALKMQREQGNGHTGALCFAQAFRSAESYRYAGRNVVVSFWAKCGANYSASSSLLYSGLVTGTGTDQPLYTMCTGAWTGYAWQFKSHTLTTNWQWYTALYAVPATATQVGLKFQWAGTGTAGADDSIYVTGFQVSRGEHASPWAPRTLEQEKTICQLGTFTPNPVTNPSMAVSQWYGTTACVSQTATANTYYIDRWSCYTGTTSTTFTTQQQTSSLPPGCQASIRIQREQGNAGTSAIYLAQAFESKNSWYWAGRTVCLSWWAKCGANYTAANSLMYGQLRTGTGTDAAWNSMGTVPINTNVCVSQNWQKCWLTGTLSSSATQLAVDFLWYPVGTAGAADWIEITGVQLNEGIDPTAWVPRSYREDVAACEPFLRVLGGNSAYETIAAGMCTAPTSAHCFLLLSPPMRGTPNLSYSAVSDWAVRDQDGTNVACSSLAFANGGPRGGQITCGTAGSMDTGSATLLRANNTTSARLYLQSEL